jgi:predicted MFS family arabinose efflux permease
MNLGFGFGSFLGGVIFEVTGGYQVALVVNVVLGLAAAISASLVPYFGQERHRRSSPLASSEQGSLPVHATG